MFKILLLKNWRSTLESSGHADHSRGNVMNSCGNSKIGPNLRGSKSCEIQEDPVGQAEISEKEDSKTDYGLNDFSIPRGTLVICQRNSNNYSSDHSFSRFKPRYVEMFGNFVKREICENHIYSGP